MGCCKDCETTAVRVTRELVFDITELNSTCDAFKGKNPKLISFRFDNGASRLENDDRYYAKLTLQGDTKANITVYQHRLPFDDLVMSIAIDRVTGKFSMRSFTVVVNQFVLELETDDDAPEQLDYVDLGNGSYRVATIKGARNLFRVLNLRSMYLDDYMTTYTMHAKGNQPVMVIHAGAYAISMTTPQHPTWKDDSLWQ